MDTPIHLKSSFLDGSIFCTKYEKPFKTAFYNGIALILISACAWGSFIILEPFLKPLFWALLCGSVLHPFKYKLSSHFKTWIIWVEESDYRIPFVVGLISCPIKAILELSEFVGDFVLKHLMKIAYSIILLMMSAIAYNYTPQLIICVLWKIGKFVVTILELSTDLFSNTTLVTSILAAYLLALTLCWEPGLRTHWLLTSYSVWFILSAYASTYCYYLKLPAFTLLQLLFLSGFVLPNSITPSQPGTDVSDHKLGGNNKNPKGDAEKPAGEAEREPTPRSDPRSEAEREPAPRSDPRSEAQGQKLLCLSPASVTSTSELYLHWVSLACVGTLLLQSGLLPLYIATCLFLLFMLRKLCRETGVTSVVGRQCGVVGSRLLEWYLLRQDILVPAPIYRVNTMLIRLRMGLLRLLRESSDSAASVMVILALVFVVIFGSTFLVIQAYTEGVYMVKVGGSVINQTVVHNPELTQLLPEGWEQRLDSVLNNAYTYGRQALSKLVRNMLSGVSEEKTAELERRALEVWDRVYQAWMMSAIEQKTTIGPKVTSSAVYQTWDHFLDAMHKTPELVSMSALTQLAQNNMVMLSSGLESAWELFRANASLVCSAVLTVLTVVFSHSFAVLNFCISMIVFLTALFYLLSSSRELYKPVEVITAISPVFGSRLAVAMENAVNEVLTASFKLAVFYGLWTWLIHTLFQMNIVYIPSVLAAMLAVVPALGTYWACLPAVLDLWLAQGKKIHAITLAVCQFLPTLFVDATIYTEINEGHPYLTGLSVAGGLFCLGMEGAITGPLILCCLYTLLSISRLMQDSSPSHI